MSLHAGNSTNLHHLIPIFFFLLLVTSQASDTCYWPSGNPMTSPQQTPCPDGVTCCSAGETCLNNGLCFNNLGFVYRGGCTDKNYGPNCPQACKDFGYTGPDDFMNLEPCAMREDYNWCCAVDKDDPASCCQNTTLIVPTSLVDGLRFGPQIHSTIVSSSTSSSSLPAVSNLEESSTGTMKSAGCHKASVTVGLGLGIPLGIAAVAGWITVWVLVRRGGGTQALHGKPTEESKNGLGHWQASSGDGQTWSAGRPKAAHELGGTPHVEADSGIDCYR